MIIGFTGTQNGMNSFQKDKLVELFDKYKPIVFHHGDCIGADAQAHLLFLEWHASNNVGIRKIVIHPPINEAKRAYTFTSTLSQSLATKLNEAKYPIKLELLQALGYHERNREIVKASDMLIAATKELEHSVRSGTWTTVRYGWHEKKQVIVIPPIIVEGKNIS